MQNSEKQPKKYLKKRFGIKTGKLTFKEKSGDYWIITDQESSLNHETEGIRAVRIMKIGLKPTTYFLQLMQDKITKNKVKITKKELEKLGNNQMIEANLQEKGYVALEYQNRVIGCGLYKDQLISSRIPKGRMKELQKTFN